MKVLTSKRKRIGRMKTMLCASAALLCGTLFGYDLDNPALTPVKKLEISSNHAPLELIKDGKLNFCIIVDDSYIRQGYTLGTAIRTLTGIMEKCTGQKPEVFPMKKYNDAAAYRYKILLGESPLTKKLGMDAKSLPREGFVVSTFADGLAIVGFDSTLFREEELLKKLDNNWNRWSKLKGTLWGVYDFAERILGCRFYFPGEWGSMYPAIDNLSIAPLSYTDAPYFLTRDAMWIDWSFAWADKAYLEKMLGTKRDQDMASKWRLCETTHRMNHNPSPKKMAELYPDKLDTIFYRAPSGTFYWDGKGNSLSCYFDVTNLKFADLLIEDAVKHRDNPKTKAAFAANDTFLVFGQCDCEIPLMDMKDNPVVVREGLLSNPSVQNYTEIYARFYKYLGDRIKKEFPGKWLYLMPYSAYTNAPKRDWRLPDNIELRVCVADFPAWVRNPERAKKVKALVDDWSKVIGGRKVISLWLYNVPGNPFARAIAPESVGEIPRLLGNSFGRQDMFFDQWGILEWNYFYSNYAASKSMWNPDFNVEKAMDELFLHFYGEKAGPFMKQFHDKLREMHFDFFSRQNERNPIYPKEMLADLEACIANADAAIPQGTVERRRFDLTVSPFAKAIEVQKKRRNYKRSVYYAPRLMDDKAFKPDGVPDEDFWKTVQPVPLMRPSTGDPVQIPSFFKIVWSEAGLYIAYESSNGIPVADPGKRLFRNSNMELFFMPKDRSSYFQYALDACGQQFFGFKNRLPVDKPFGPWKAPNVKSAFKVQEKSWSAECFIPFTDFKYPAPKPYSAWYMNLVSNTGPVGGTCMTLGNNHNVESYGFIQFLGKGDKQ